MSKLQALLKSRDMYIGLAVGVIVALAFARFIPGFVKKAAAAIPGSDAKAGA
jgi:large-conductance mechanosensitive channel